ncbi:MAG: PolC-type DNA polymerase III [Bacilli bacterium]|nr:PolC-type DNA polymerase III [Bacilli bacterium]
MEFEVDSKILRFLKSIGIENSDPYDFNFVSISASGEDKKHYSYVIQKFSPWNYADLDRFINALGNITTYTFDLSFIYSFNYSFDDLLPLIKEWYTSKFFEPCDFFDISLKGSVLNIIQYKEHPNFEAKMDELMSFLRFIGLSYNLKITEKYKEEENKKVVINEEEIAKGNEENFNQIVEKTEEEIILEAKNNYKLMLEERKNSKMWKRGDYVHVLCSQIDSNSQNVDVDGKIFQISNRELKNKKVMFNIGIFDDTGAITVKAIANNNSMPIEVLSKLDPGKNIRVRGAIAIDSFRGNNYINCHFLDLLPDDELRNDDYEGKKRVELHLHTKMSEMDGVSEIEDYVKLAKHMGHEAIAVTDHGVVQSFPNAQEVAKKTGMKILYGCELYMIEDYLKGSKNATDLKLNDATFVCFDLETTGLSTTYDKITEFAGVKMRNGVEIDRLDILINPEMKIPEKIVKKTHITNEMVADKPTIKEALPYILEFLKGTVLVSHNIEFDYGKLNEAMVNNGFGELNMPAIDTLDLSKFIFPSSLKHSLGALSKRLEIVYDDEDAHRADYDAQVLAKCFPLITDKLKEIFKDCTLKDIERLQMPKELFKARTFKTNHVVVLCRNQKGLKDLYEIVSTSHIEYMGNIPLTPRSLIEKYRDTLIVGSACFNGDVFYAARNLSKKDLRERIKFYDYIEIQPLENYSYLINMGEVDSVEELKKYLTDIVTIAKEENKLICATGDCHYCNPKDKVYRDIFIANQAVGGFNHPLYPFARQKMPHFENPDQHYRSTTEMLDAFSWLGEKDAYEFVVENTNKIAEMCEFIKPIPDGIFPPEIENCSNLLRELCYENLHKYYGENPLPEIKERLDNELNGIINNGYSVTYYIAHKLVKLSNDAGYIVGSRGSVGSSFAATMAGITEVNPLAPHYRCPNCKHTEFYKGNEYRDGYDLPDKFCPECGTLMIGDGHNIPFQTFLGFNAEKVPDIDLNFPADYQSTAFEFTKDLLGEKNVYRAGTISTVQEKTAFGYVRKYIESFLKENPDNYDGNYIAALAYGCVGTKRTTGQHPGGIVVIPNKNDVTDFTPIQWPAGDTESSWKTTHFDFHKIHDTILKLDMLGHVDPQALKMMCDLKGIDYKAIPLNDRKVYSLFINDDALNMQHKYMKPDNGALGLPEFGTKICRQLLREAKPHNFAEIAVVSGLSHGTNVWANNQEDLILNGITDLNGLIGCRDDIMVYLISKGIEPSKAFSIMETVRKTGKKLSLDDLEVMKEHDVPQYYIDACNKIAYLFPKGHACAYSIMALRVGYFKIYYPLEFYATYFTLRCDQYEIETMIKDIDGVNDRINELRSKEASKMKLTDKEKAILDTLLVVLEMYERGIKIKNIDLEKSDASAFIVDEEDNALIPPFKVLDGLGEIAGQSVVDARKERPFSSKDDLLKRTKLSKTNVEQLSRLGALKNLQNDEEISLFDFSF